jgi:hypothetical protein
MILFKLNLKWKTKKINNNYSNKIKHHKHKYKQAYKLFVMKFTRIQKIKKWIINLLMDLNKAWMK